MFDDLRSIYFLFSLLSMMIIGLLYMGEKEELDKIETLLKQMAEDLGVINLNLNKVQHDRVST